MLPSKALLHLTLSPQTTGASPRMPTVANPKGSNATSTKVANARMPTVPDPKGSNAMSAEGRTLEAFKRSRAIVGPPSLSRRRRIVEAAVLLEQALHQGAPASHAVPLQPRNLLISGVD
jgi:hypothetical protein